VSLEDQRPVNRWEHAVAKRVAAQVQALIAWREQQTLAQALDPRTDLPAGNWRLDSADNDFVEAYRHVARADYATINNLRYYTNTFTGYKLIHFCPNHGMRSVMPVPDDVRGAILGNLHRLGDVIERYLRLKSQLSPGLLIAPYPRMGEVGVDIDGVIVNQDTLRQQATIAALWQLRILAYLRRRVAQQGTAHIVEIGAGYGSLCYHLKRLIPELTYTIVDLPEALLFAGIYLATAAPEWKPTLARPKAPPRAARGGISLVPNFQFAEALGRLPGVDLALNISSFGEMSPEQVDVYARGLSTAMRGGGLVFHCNEVGVPHIKARAIEIFCRHFAVGDPATGLEFGQYEGAPYLHANQPLETILPPPRGRVMRLWERFRSRPLRQWPGRILARVRKALAA
jgi:hypothetical protein